MEWLKKWFGSKQQTDKVKAMETFIAMEAGNASMLILNCFSQCDGEVKQKDGKNVFVSEDLENFFKRGETVDSL